MIVFVYLWYYLINNINPTIYTFIVLLISIYMLHIFLSQYVRYDILVELFLFEGICIYISMFKLLCLQYMKFFVHVSWVKNVTFITEIPNYADVMLNIFLLYLLIFLFGNEYDLIYKTQVPKPPPLSTHKIIIKK